MPSGKNRNPQLASSVFGVCVVCSSCSALNPNVTEPLVGWRTSAGVTPSIKTGFVTSLVSETRPFVSGCQRGGSLPKVLGRTNDKGQKSAHCLNLFTK